MLHTLTHLFIYPVKSLGGIAVNEALMTKRGLQYDRRYMLVDENNHFMTQRENHRMALMKLKIREDHFEISYLHSNALLVPKQTEQGDLLTVQVWDDVCDAIHLPQCDYFFSNALDKKCKLVYMREESLRPLPLQYAAAGDITSFSDGYPVLLFGSASLSDLNGKLQTPLGWDRFRPNIVVETQAPFEEDDWKKITIGDAQFRVAKPCARCVITTIDQATGEAGKEPLRTLSTYRTMDKKVMFGQNLIPDSLGVKVTVGNKLEVLS
ncbi:MAG: MOSC domain-containing protein [Flavobacteriales bacterium]